MSAGRNVWFDLMTSDVAGAQRFYGEVIGWKTQPWEDADPKEPYAMWTVGEQPIGGVMRLPDEAKKMGAPPHWIAYTTVDDVDETVDEAVELGAKLLKAPFDIPTVGRSAFLADPQGAVFSVFTPEDDMDSPPDAHGQFSWSELNTTDYEAAWKFYAKLFGWQKREAMDMGPPVGTYFMFQSESEATKGGMSNVATAMKVPPHWLYYVTVSDIKATLERVIKLGGKVMNGPMEIPGDDLIAQCVDPQGAFFAVYQHGKK
jgi:predicted enzyme related to lactoylglutathione lyase